MNVSHGDVRVSTNVRQQQNDASQSDADIDADMCAIMGVLEEKERAASNKP